MDRATDYERFLTIATKEKAQSILLYLTNEIDKNGHANFDYLMDLLNEPAEPNDLYFGWDDLTGASIKEVQDGYFINLPPVKYLVADDFFEDDPIDHPEHYTNGDIECIEAIEAAMDPKEYKGYLRGQIFKYVWRCELKGKEIQDLEKADWYLNRLIDYLKEMENRYGEI